jgi:uncharacterized membrane-anchored protein
MYQNAAFVVWVGIAVLALVWAKVSLWHAGRTLSQSRQTTTRQAGRNAASAGPAMPRSVDTS